MKKLLLIGSILLSTSALASLVGDKIHFQSESSYISAVYNKSLCFDGEDFHALVTKCVAWRNSGDEDRCTRYGKVEATQPQESTRLRCARTTGRDGNCSKWERVRYFQDDVRTVKFYNDRDQLLRTETVSIPSCE